MKCTNTECPFCSDNSHDGCTLGYEDVEEYFGKCPKRTEAQKPEAVLSNSTDGLAGVLAEAKRGFAEAKDMRKQYEIAKNKTKAEFWRGEAMAFFRIITFIDKAS